MTLSCERARAAISARVDGEIGEAEGAQLDAHLVQCLACTEWDREVAALAAFLKRVLAEDPGPTERLISAVRDALTAEVKLMRRVGAVLGVLTLTLGLPALFPVSGPGLATAAEALLGVAALVVVMHSSPHVAGATAVVAATAALGVVGRHGDLPWSMTRHLVLVALAWALWRLGRLLRKELRWERAAAGRC